MSFYVILNYQINAFSFGTVDKKKSKEIQIPELTPLLVVVADVIGEDVVDGLVEVVVVIAC
jgi:hypothetical protein